MFQSTHPHGVRPEGIKAQNDLVNVSIHAPTRGATTYTVWGWLYFQFQSTHPHGVRHNAPMPSDSSVYVSIHAPTRGATYSRVYYDVLISSFQSTHPHGVRPSHSIFRLCFACFNPRTHTGCDKADYFNVNKRGLFQSTHPHGVRQNYLRKLVYL